MKKSSKKNLKRPREESDDEVIVDEFDKINDTNTEQELQVLIFGRPENEIENIQRYEISKLKERIEKLTMRVKNLVANSKDQEKKIRTLRKNNQKKWKLLTAEELRDKSWNDYALTIFNEKDIERYEELENCWYSSEESADESERQK